MLFTKAYEGKFLSLSAHSVFEDDAVHLCYKTPILHCWTTEPDVSPLAIASTDSLLGNNDPEDAVRKHLH